MGQPARPASTGGAGRQAPATARAATPRLMRSGPSEECLAREETAEAHQQPGGRPPDVVLPVGQRVIVTLSAEVNDAVALVVGRIEQKPERHLEYLRNLEIIGLQFKRRAQQAHP